MRDGDDTVAEALLLLPLPIWVPVLGVFDKTAETPTGLVVVQLSVTLQLLPPARIVQLGAAGVRVPDVGAMHADPFQLDPVAHIALTVDDASNTWL